MVFKDASISGGGEAVRHEAGASPPSRRVRANYKSLLCGHLAVLARVMPIHRDQAGKLCLVASWNLLVEGLTGTLATSNGRETKKNGANSWRLHHDMTSLLHQQKMSRTRTALALALAWSERSIYSDVQSHNAATIAHDS